MDWREAEKIVVDKCEELKTKLEFYTPDDVTADDINGHYYEAEFFKKLRAMKDAYCEAGKSIRELLCVYDDVMPTHCKREECFVL